MYTLRLLPPAIEALAQLDKPIAQRLVNRLRWLSGNLDNINPEALSGELAGFFKLRSGDYRIIYEILRHDRVIIVHRIGHRREIYRQR